MKEKESNPIDTNVRHWQTSYYFCPQCEQHTEILVGLGSDGKLWEYRERCVTCHWQIKLK